ncbi:MAG: hypothetical protein LBF92_01500, partial [Synergistaceae bacterium]|nr:hypothetical protein [Synergistaceae bacterium]
MKGDGLGNLQGATFFDATLDYTLETAKRTATRISQIAVDLLVYWVCLELALRLWVSSQASFLLELRLFFCGVIFVCFYFHGLYQLRSWMFWDEMREVLSATGASMLIIVLFLFAMKLQLSRLAIGVSFMLFLPSCLVARYLFRRLLFGLGIQKTRVLVIGAGKTGELYAQKVKQHPFMGCEIQGFLDDDASRIGSFVAGIPILGVVADFPRVQSELNVSEAVVAIPSATRDLFVRVLETVEMRVRSVSYIPDMYMLTTFSATIREVDGVPLISAPQGLLNPWNRIMKGVMDYVGAVLALIVFSPVFLYAAWKI